MKKKTVLIIDGGGRGAVLADKYAQSNAVGKILVVPGNDLIKLNIKKPLKIFPQLTTTSVKEIVELAKKEKVDLVDVNQDNAVAVGLVDELQKNGVTAIGPTKEAGQIEWDKAWARDFMKKYAIPHPAYHVFHSVKDGIKFLNKQRESKWFIKAAGLAGGYGVLPAENNKQALEKIEELQQFKDAAKTYLIEEWLVGEEFSSYILADGKDFVLLGHAQDNKRLENFDEGPNTGGIGCNTRPLVITKTIEKQITEIFTKTITGLAKEGRPYFGTLYLGGMIVNDKVFVIEFNSRWGDPESEVILPGIKNDYYALSLAALDEKIKKTKIKTDGKTRVLVTACANGYPFNLTPVKGKQIFGISEVIKIKGINVYSSGVKEQNGKYVVSGGRMFHIIGEGKNILEAREKAYAAMAKISVEGNNLHYRTDIGWRDAERMRNLELNRRVERIRNKK